MRVILSFAFLAATLPAQNLLAWNGWQPWNPQYVTQLNVTPTAISFVPYAPGPPSGVVCGVEQQILVPTPGTYQLYFIGGGGSSGVFAAHWEVQGQQTPTFASYDQQRTWTFQLTAGMAMLRLQTSTSNLTADLWHLEQPVLRPVFAPAIEIEFVSRAMPQVTITTDAEILAFAPQIQTPLRLPGFLHGLELAPTSAIVILATTSTPPATVQIGSQALLGRSWPSFYLQAVSLSPAPRFGDALGVRPWRF